MSDEVDLPRRQAGPNPQHLLLSMMGDFWVGLTAPIPSAALVALLQECGITANSARVAINRLVRRNVLVGVRRGRESHYHLAEAVVVSGVRGLPRMMTFGSSDEDEAEWDGTWVLVSITAPPEQAAQRRTLRTRLRALGFGMLTESLWIAPSTQKDPAVELVTELDVSAMVVHGTVVHPVTSGVLNALKTWPLTEVRAEYEDFIATYQPVVDRARQGQVSPSEAFVLRLYMTDQWRGLYRHDPGLPSEVLPADWPRGRAYEVFAELYDRLGPLAEFRCAQVVAPHAHPDMPPPRHYAIRDGFDAIMERVASLTS
ncbi:phenylacetic acid degradation operon negative regulatory protein [Lipingzhangella halophila]|uniref:Phenylacetic acid degradation operon negative regulatory protein n=1 Tax=Lipingzhangella halophila TaxID=1783352 RepID=A0A7W7RJ06_9ACTN|nr:PaaX family transcriptional regulator C-terminal domain-containing protein [Lipingzhangella halophila]MBB4932884.1 phenylacetic acid degradation operon negative regulatory protein [Lipingzhangella halophila]